MKEIVFVKKNQDRWKETEEAILNRKQTDAQILSGLFVQLTDDLAYAQTYYPHSKTTNYLNQLAILVHQKMYKTKKENIQRIKQFFKYDYPLLLASSYDKIIYSFIIFTVACLIGAFSASNDVDFVRLIMGDEYVNMTLENIKEGKPLGVYGRMEAFPMFFYITFNNIKVALIAFALGGIVSLGTGAALFSNGVMLGAFQYFFYQQNFLVESATGIWMHGTIEIFSIIIAGAAGLTFGNSILFPGTYSRKESLVIGAKKGAKMVVGLIPFFFIAGFIEGYLTRHYNLSWLAVFVIASSIILLLSYFFIYPILLSRNVRTGNNS